MPSILFDFICGCTFFCFVPSLFNVPVNLSKAGVASAIVSAKYNTICQHPSAGWLARSFVRLMFYGVFNTDQVILWRLVKLTSAPDFTCFTFLVGKQLTACSFVSVLKEEPQVVLMRIYLFGNK